MRFRLKDTRRSVLGNQVTDFKSRDVKIKIEELLEEYTKQKVRWSIAPTVSPTNKAFICTSNQLIEDFPLPIVLTSKRDEEEIKLMINFKVKRIPTGILYDSWESCYSQKTPSKYYKMKRNFLIYYSYQTETGQKKWGFAIGFKSRQYQHEYDHLRGIQINYDSKAKPRDKSSFGKGLY